MVPHHTFPAHRGRVTALTYAEEGQVFVSAGAEGMMRFWDVANGHSCGEWRVDSGVACMAVSPSGTRLATMANHNRPVATVDVAPSGRIGASASYNGTVRLWKIDDCEEIESISNDRRRTAGAVFSPGSALSRNRRLPTSLLPGWPLDGNPRARLPGAILDPRRTDLHRKCHPVRQKRSPNRLRRRRFPPFRVIGAHCPGNRYGRGHGSRPDAALQHSRELTRCITRRRHRRGRHSQWGVEAHAKA